MTHTLTPLALAVALACAAGSAQAQAAATPAGAAASAPSPAAAASAPSAASAPVVTLPPVKIVASADASVEGLSKPYAGGQVARGGRAGILGTKDNLDTPFSITSYTNALIQDRQARSVGEVLQSDPGVRVARGFGNFQESYFIRGFLLSSDDVAYNGLYSLLPRQYIATELFERVEVLRGASAFLTGANPGGGGIGGAINLLPKRAGNEALTRITVGASQGPQGNVAADVSRRFGPDQALGVRVNAAYRDGGTSVDDEKAKLGLLAVALDWRSSAVRLSGDIGFQDNRLKETRPNVATTGLSVMPGAPEASSNWAQAWSYSNERDLFGTFRGEVDILSKNALTAWVAYGLRRSDEANSLANLDLTDGATGAGTFSRFDNTREDTVDTGELGLRGKLRTGPVGHEWVVSASAFQLKKKGAFAVEASGLATNLYAPVRYAQPPFTGAAVTGNDLASPALTGKTRLVSFAVGDTLSMLDDTLLFTLGARHQQIRIEDYAYGTGAQTTYDQDRVSPVLGLVYRATPKVSVYGNYVEGLTQGATLAGPPEIKLPPAVAKQKEVGVKYDTGKLGLAAGLFMTDRPRSVAGATSPRGKDRHRGIEITAYGQAFPELKVLGGFSWLDTEQSSTGVPATEGKQVIGVPKFQGTLGYEWTLPQVEGLALDLRAVHTGESYADSENTLRVPRWTRFDLGARYLFDWHGSLVTLRARVDNVADKNYWASVGGYSGYGYLVAGAPRTFSVSASVDF